MDPRNPRAGGQEKYVFEMARRLVTDGHRVVWIASGSPGLKAHELLENIDIIRTGNIYTYFMSYFLHYFRIKGNSLFFISMNAIPFLLPLRKSRRIVMLHHRMDLKVMREKIGLLGYFSYFLQEFVNPLLFRRDHVITNSKSSRDDFLELGYMDINVIKSGIDIPEAINVQKRKIIVSPGPMKPWKHHDLVMRAFSQMDESWELVMFGAFESEKYRQFLEALSAELGISGRVRFLGRISDSEVAKTYRESTLCVLGTEKEGWGLVAMEAQSNGCPVVAFDVPGIRDSVSNGRTGILVNFGDTLAMAEAMKKIVSDDSLLAELSQNSVKRSREYSWDECYREFTLELDKATAFRNINGEDPIAQQG